MSGIALNEVIATLKKFAPLELADRSWDNVGLLVEPNNENRKINKIFLTNDLTEPVLDEAIEENAQLIISYHPPIFSPLKKLTQNSWKERIVLNLIRHQIALFSPHTSWDALDGGINDWIISAFGKENEDFTSNPIQQVKLNETPSKSQYLLTITLPKDKNLTEIENFSIVNKIDCKTFDGDSTQFSICCSQDETSRIVKMFENEPKISKTIQIVELEKPLSVREGYGRMIKLTKVRTIGEIVENVKTLTGLKNVRLALANGKTIDSNVSTIGVCAGSGSTVFSAVRRVDVQITGELTHHFVLDAIHRETTVILCDHSNTERGFLRIVKNRLEQIWSNDKVELIVSQRDRDPLEIV